MSAKIFILLLVCLLMVDTGVKAHDGRIKLCGREFVRMVISSCGSSRLRRHAPELEEAHRDIYSDLLDHMSSDQSPSSGNWEDQQQQQQHQQQEWTLEHAVSTDQRRTPLQGTGAPLQGTGTPLQGTGTPLEGTGELEVQRVRRDTGPAGLCCRSGCTISELVQFC
ncbi:insulin-like 3 (Leydig cell) [Clupea harengus]|uniref:Insulin-like 3 (Leydig cell) n=1 Tax=Clupea harengus TaxID=7950 RepID=A0A6P3VY80_CLUHA|nr:insulin-like 3 (Leydig cell) [Clupea harengus]